MISFRRKLFAIPTQSQQVKAQVSQNSLQKTQIVRQGNMQTQQMIQQRQAMNMQKMQQRLSMDRAKMAISRAKMSFNRDKELMKHISRTKQAEHKLNTEKAKNISLFKRPAKTVEPVPMKN